LYFSILKQDVPHYLPHMLSAVTMPWPLWHNECVTAFASEAVTKMLKKLGMH